MSTSPLPLLVEPEQLAASLDDPNLLIVDLRAHNAYQASHIGNAVHLDYGAIIRAEPPVGGLLATPEQLSQVLGAIGFSADRHVIAYDDEGGGRAARLLWTLEALGHQRLSLLNGGIVAWAMEDRPLQTGNAMAELTPTHYQAHFSNLEVVAERDYIQSRLGSEDFLALDARTPGEYQGLDCRAARGGHIPGAVNFDWVHAVDRDRALRFKPDAELRALLEPLGVTPDKEIVAYCQTHHRSSHTYMVLKYLGYPRRRGYHGAWSDWGNAPDTPIAS